jgi:hypothetical protein
MNRLALVIRSPASTKLAVRAALARIVPLVEARDFSHMKLRTNQRRGCIVAFYGPVPKRFLGGPFYVYLLHRGKVISTTTGIATLARARHSALTSGAHDAVELSGDDA